MATTSPTATNCFAGDEQPYAANNTRKTTRTAERTNALEGAAPAEPWGKRFGSVYEYAYAYSYTDPNRFPHGSAGAAPSKAFVRSAVRVVFLVLFAAYGCSSPAKQFVAVGDVVAIDRPDHITIRHDAIEG